MAISNIKSYWTGGNLYFISRYGSPSTAPFVRFGQTDNPLQVKIHNRPAAADSTLELRGRPETDAATHFCLDAQVEWRPASSGTGGQRGVQGVAKLGSGYTMSGSASLVGTYGQVQNVGTVNGSGIMMAGLYGLIEDGGTYTAVSHVTPLWVDSHLAQTVTSGSFDMQYITNNGSTTADNVFYIYAGNKITNLFTIATASGMVSDATTSDYTFTKTRKIKVVAGGETGYLIMDIV